MRRLVALVVVATNSRVVCNFVAGQARPSEWSAVVKVLEDAVGSNVFPGAVALVGNANGTLFKTSVGAYTNDGRNPPWNDGKTPNTSTNAIFDMASCTKVVATTSAVAILYQENFLQLDAQVSSYLGEDFRQNGKGNITVRNCLLHNAGFPPDPTPCYWDKRFGCEGAPVPKELSFTCSSAAYNSLLGQTLALGVGQKYVYSDLSFLTLMYVVGKVVLEHGLVNPGKLLHQCATSTDLGAILQCHFEAFVRTKVFEPLGMNHTMFRPPRSLWPQCMPTGVPLVEHVDVVLQGEVNDGNAYMLGGIAGHAGLFSNALDLEIFLRAYLWPSTNIFLNKTTVATFTREYNNTQSSRALGWNTNDPTTPDYGWDLSCGNMSAATYTHVGYTGTQVCLDPVEGLYTILLTNRVYPNDSDHRIVHVRKVFNNAVLAAISDTKVIGEER